MNAKARRSRIPARIVLALAAVVGVVAWAMPPYQEALFARYPNAAPALPNCIACHESPAANSLNNFGSDYLANGLEFNAALDARDSDGDGVSNGAELTASPASAPGDPASRPGAVTPPTTPPVIVTDGATLYANYCAACHAPLASSTKVGATLARTQAAIADNVDGMGYLASLSVTQLQAIEAVLAAAAPPAQPPVQPPVVPPPTTIDGAALYASRCAACHGALATSTKIGATLARTQAAITGNVGGMGTLSSLSTDELQAIAKALAPAAPAVPVTPFPGAPANYSGMWWNPAESGWSVNVNHQGDIVFATLLTYDAAGAPLWLVLLEGLLQPDGRTFSGALYRTTGPAFDAQPFAPITDANLTSVGTMALTFESPRAATLAYNYLGVPVNKNVVPLVFGSAAASCGFATGSRAALTNYQDAWWNPAESGWGLFVVHQDNTLFSALTTYDFAGRPLWLVSTGALQPDGSFAGDLFQTSGPAFNAQPFAPITDANLAKVGAMRLAFSDGATGTLAYTVNNALVSKSITRTVFSDRVPACTSPTTAATGVPPAGTDGATLYANHCASCHQSLASSTKGGATLARTQSAIAGNVGGMGYLSALSTTQLQAIVGVLAGASPPPPSSTATDGPTLYANHCASCHQSLASSTKGGATLARTQSAIAGNVGGMGYLSSLSTTQLQAIVTALAKVPPTTPPGCGSCHAIPPKTGKHDKHRSRSCATCHGAGYSSTAVNSVTHNNGVKNLAASSIGWNSTTRSCSNSCHGKESWK
jgi:mono/diheme cytochrome c family protein